MERQPAQKFEDLVMWQRGHQLVLRVYRVTSSFPKHELFGLTSQMRRAAVSVPANIAEGFSRRGKADKARFMNNAQSSLEELRYYTILARDLEYVSANQLWPELQETGSMLGAYARNIRASST